MNQLRRKRRPWSRPERWWSQFLGCTRYNSYLLSSVEANDQSDYYAALLNRFNNILKKKRPHLAKKKVLFHQDNARGSHVLGTDGQIQRIPLRIASPSSIFARFSPLRLFAVSKPEEMIRRKEIYYQRAAHCRNRGLFWRVGQIIQYYSDGLKKLENRWIKWMERLDRAERRLCWEIKMNRSKKMCFTKNLLTVLIFSFVIPFFFRFSSERT